MANRCQPEYDRLTEHCGSKTTFHITKQYMYVKNFWTAVSSTQRQITFSILKPLKELNILHLNSFIGVILKNSL